MGSQHPLDEATARAAVNAAFDAVKADDLRVEIKASTTGFTRYAANEVTTSGVADDVEVSISCAVGRKHASVTLNGLDSGRIADAARRALALAELAPEDPEFVPDVGATELQPVPAAWSDAAASAGPEARADLVATGLAEVKKRKLIGAGFVQQECGTEVVATRRGFFAVHHGSYGSLSTTVRTPDGSGSGWASANGVKPENLDMATAAAVACDKAERSHKPQPLDPGEYPVVLEAAAVRELLLFLGNELQARAADEGRSCFAKAGGATRVGERLLGALHLSSDPRSSLLPGAPFDGEGVARQPVTWVADGTLKRLAYSRYWAKKTGHAADARPHALIARGPKTTSAADLIAGLDRGLLVTRFWYIRMLEPQTLRVTGLTRDGVFLVEKGKIVRPVNNFRFNQSIVDMFANTEAYGAPIAVDGAVAPALRCRRFHMASRSDAV
jgi:predicted Zn-dependent protease